MLFTHSEARRGGLPDIELFHGCRARELREFARCCTTVSVRSGRVLCRQGEIGQECFVIVAGRADVFIDGARVATGGTGDLVGELALLADRAIRTATVLATTDMQLLVLSRREFAALAESSPGVLQRVLREATRRLVENSARR